MSTILQVTQAVAENALDPHINLVTVGWDDIV